MNDCILSVRGLEYRYSSTGGSFSVQLPELDLRPGEFVGLVGSSGSGKSTLLDLLGLVRKPSASNRFILNTEASCNMGGVGTQEIDKLWSDGNDSSLSQIRSHNLGYILQRGGLIPYLCVGENIELPRRIAGLSVSRAETVKALKSMGLDWGYHKSVSDLSGGERQRVAILRAISHRPRLILADEPTAAVDNQRAQDVVAVLAEVAKSSGSSVLMVSHDVALTSSVATRVLSLRPQSVDDPNTTRFSTA